MSLTLNDDGNTYPVKYGFVNATAGATAAIIVSAVAARLIIPISYELGGGATATTATFKSGTGTGATAISPNWNIGENGGRISGERAHGCFQTLAGEALTLAVGTGFAVGAQVAYIEKPDA